LAALALTATVSNIVGEEEKVPEYTFEDHFDGPVGSAPDPTKWMYEIGGGGHGNNELETYTDNHGTWGNSYLDGNSNLVIAATYSDGVYYSAQLRTQGLFSQIGGHFEARIKLNPQAGVWPAFWLMGQNIDTVNWPQCGEIDIMELFGASNTIQSTVHTPNGNTTYQRYGDIAIDTDWHTYRADVNGEGAAFFLDGYEFLHVPASFSPASAWVFGPEEPNNGGLFFLLNVAVGGSMPGNPDPTKFPATMLVDYVRAWA
jgi:beta-glucanase (GH16 family)